MKPPKLPIVYKLAYVYKIHSPNTELVYIGSYKRNNLSQRLYEHVYDSKTKRVDCGSALVINAGSYSIEVIETLKDVTAYQIRAREQYHISTNRTTNKTHALSKKIDNVRNGDPITCVKYLFSV